LPINISAMAPSISSMISRGRSWVRNFRCLEAVREPRLNCGLLACGSDMSIML
jgi:hypothetical protein